MATTTYTCPKCGTVTEYEYDDGNSYSSMFNEGEWVSIHCRNPDCRHELGQVREY